MMSRYRVTPPFFQKVHWMTPIFVRFHDEPFLSYDPIFGKVHRMTLMTLTCSKVNNTNMHVTYTPEGQIFVLFAIWWAIFELQANFQKSAWNDPKWSWHVQGQQNQHAYYIHPRGPNFRPFRSMINRFWVTAQFSEKCTEWPQMTLICSRSKIPICMIHTPPGPHFRLFCSTMSRFWVSGQFSEKCTEWPQMTFKNTQIFVRFALRWVVFKEIEIFEFPIGYDVKI